MFLLKKFISRLLFPVSLSAEVLVAGLVTLLFTRKQRTGKLVVSLGVALLLLLGSRSVSSQLLKPLEDRYPPLSLKSEDEIRNLSSSVKYVIVLGAGSSSDLRLPPTGQIGSETMARLVEGLRLCRDLHRCKLILSGGKVFEAVSEAEAMAKVADALGVSREDIVLESRSRDTAEQARLLQPMVGRDSFVLVTSASHMPRSMALFKKLGMNPIPAPTYFLALDKAQMGLDDYCPSTEGLETAEKAFHEYMGLAWERLTGQI